MTHLDNLVYKTTADMPVCYDGKPVKDVIDDKEDRGPLCPYCYDGEIVEDDNIKGVFLCNRCFHRVKIRKYNR